VVHAEEAGRQAGESPGIFQEVFPVYHGVVWYWREFTPPAHPYAQGRYLLRFGAVDYLGDVWVTGSMWDRTKVRKLPSF